MEPKTLTVGHSSTAELGTGMWPGAHYQVERASFALDVQDRMQLTPELNAAILQFLDTAETQLASQRGSPERPHLQMVDSADHNGFSQLALRAGTAGSNVLRRLAPYGLQMVVSAAAYSMGLGLFQLLGYGLRVSCNTRVVSSCLGCLGVGVSSAMAGHLSRHVQRQLEQEGLGSLLRTPPWKGFDSEEAFLDAVVGITCFKAWKGQFKSLMPSNLTQPGAWSAHSIQIEGDPATSGSRYAMGTDRKQLQTFMKRHGCHHCGTKTGEVIGDHIPPTKIFTQLRAERQAKPPPPHVIKQAAANVLNWIGGPDTTGRKALRQQWYPQCRSCCSLQSSAIRHSGSRTPLLIHWRIWRLPPPGFAPGLVASLRPVTLRDIFGPPQPPVTPPAGSNKVKTSNQAGNKGQAGGSTGRGGWWWQSTQGPLVWGPGLIAYAAAAEGNMHSMSIPKYGGSEDGDHEHISPLVSGPANPHTAGLWAWSRPMDADDSPGPDVFMSVESLNAGLTAAAVQVEPGSAMEAVSAWLARNTRPPSSLAAQCEAVVCTTPTKTNHHPMSAPPTQPTIMELPEETSSVATNASHVLEHDAVGVTVQAVSSIAAIAAAVPASANSKHMDTMSDIAVPWSPSHVNLKPVATETVQKPARTTKDSDVGEEKVVKETAQISAQEAVPDSFGFIASKLTAQALKSDQSNLPNQIQQPTSWQLLTASIAATNVEDSVAVTPVTATAFTPAAPAVSTPSSAVHDAPNYLPAPAITNASQPWALTSSTAARFWGWGVRTSNSLNSARQSIADTGNVAVSMNSDPQPSGSPAARAPPSVFRSTETDSSIHRSNWLVGSDWDMPLKSKPATVTPVIPANVTTPSRPAKVVATASSPHSFPLVLPVA